MKWLGAGAVGEAGPARLRHGEGGVESETPDASAASPVLPDAWRRAGGPPSRSLCLLIRKEGPADIQAPWSCEHPSHSVHAS